MIPGIKWHYKQRLKRKKKDDELDPALTKKLHKNIQKLEIKYYERKELTNSVLREIV